jgi:hypothetical protein
MRQTDGIDRAPDSITAAAAAGPASGIDETAQ